MRIRNFLAALLVMVVGLAACGRQPNAIATLAPTPAEIVPTNAATAPTTAAVAQPTPDGPELLSGHTPEGYNYLGSPTAPVTIVFYSDFL
jgi:hypothetical protein